MTTESESAATVPSDHGENPALDADLQHGLHITQEDNESLSNENVEINLETLELLAQVVPDNEEIRPVVLHALGFFLVKGFKATGAVEDIEKAIMHQEQGLLLTPDEHPDKPKYLTSLSISQQTHFEHSGEIEYLRKAISNQERAVLLTPDGTWVK